MGYKTTASGIVSTAMGVLTTASSDYSTAMGKSTKANNIYSTAMGVDTTASGYASTSMGRNTEASGTASTAMGEYNKIDVTSLFVVGNGTDSERNNAFEVKDNGIIIGNANNMTVDNINLLDIINKQQQQIGVQQQQIESLIRYIQPMKSCNCSVGLLQCDNVSHVVDSYKTLNRCSN